MSKKLPEPSSTRLAKLRASREFPGYFEDQYGDIVDVVGKKQDRVQLGRQLMLAQGRAAAGSHGPDDGGDDDYDYDYGNGDEFGGDSNVDLRESSRGDWWPSYYSTAPAYSSSAAAQGDDPTYYSGASASSYTPPASAAQQPYHQPAAAAAAFAPAPAAQPQGDNHPFLTPAPAAYPNGPSRSGLQYFAISDHLPVEFESTFQDGTKVKILTWNMMNKCKDNTELRGFSNNQYNFSEMQDDGSYARRIEKEKLFLEQKLSTSNPDRPDFINLQEVNGLTALDKNDEPIIKSDFLKRMQALGYGAIYSRSRDINANAKPLITLYRTDLYAPPQTDFVMPDKQGRSTLMLSNFIKLSDNSNIVIGNAHLDYQADPANIKSEFEKMKARHPKFLATGDMNHNHEDVGGISDGQPTTFDAVIDGTTGATDFTQQTTIDARNGQPKTYDCLVAGGTNGVVEVVTRREFTLVPCKSHGSGKSFVQCFLEESKTRIIPIQQHAFAAGAAATPPLAAARHPGATASATTSSSLDDLTQALTTLIAKHKAVIKKPNTSVPLNIRGTVYNLSQTTKAGSKETIYYLTMADSTLSPQITITVKLPSKPIIKSELSGSTILYGEGHNPVTGGQLIPIDKSATMLQLVQDISAMAAASAGPLRPSALPTGPIAASAAAASNAFTADFDTSRRNESLYNTLNAAIPLFGDQTKQSGRFSYVRQKNCEILCTVKNLYTTDVITLYPGQETQYQSNNNADKKLISDKDRFDRAINAITLALGITLPGAGRGSSRS